ncbi:MAG: hypothetical protein RR240_03950, partial [Burkholderiaceae bacterium]
AVMAEALATEPTRATARAIFFIENMSALQERNGGVVALRMPPTFLVTPSLTTDVDRLQARDESYGRPPRVTLSLAAKALALRTGSRSDDAELARDHPQKAANLLPCSANMTTLIPPNSPLKTEIFRRCHGAPPLRRSKSDEDVCSGACGGVAQSISMPWLLGK